MNEAAGKPFYSRLTDSGLPMALRGTPLPVVSYKELNLRNVGSEQWRKNGWR